MTERVFAIENAPKPDNPFWHGIEAKIGMIGRHAQPARGGRPGRGTYANSCFMADQPRKFHPEVFTVCRLAWGKVIVAGGCALALAESSNAYMYHNDIDRSSKSKFRASDLDLYIRAASHSEAPDVVSNLLEYLNPTGVVVRTKYALSFYCDISRCIEELGWDCIRYNPKTRIIRVQIIDRVVPRTASIEDDLSYLFQTYDLDCCKWASDGQKMYTTDSAIEAYVSRLCIVPWSKVTDSTIPRMARYFSRCYDFDIEGFSTERTFFPGALEKIAELLRTKVSLSDLPQSNYSTTSDYSSTCGADPMFRMFRAHGQTGAEPYMICGTKEDAMHMVLRGTQPDTYMFDWCMETMNKMAETVLWMVSPDHEEDRAKFRECCSTTIDEWRNIMRHRVRFPRMFSEPLQLVGLSPEVFQKYWQPQPICKIYSIVG